MRTSKALSHTPWKRPPGQDDLVRRCAEKRRALGARPAPLLPKARGAAPVRLRNDGKLGAGRKTCSLHCDKTARPPRRARTRAHGPRSRARARASGLPPSLPRMLWEEGGGGA